MLVIYSFIIFNITMIDAYHLNMTNSKESPVIIVHINNWRRHEYDQRLFQVMHYYVWKLR